MPRPAVADAFFNWSFIDVDGVVDAVRAALPVGGIDFHVDGRWLSDTKVRVHAVRKDDRRGFGLELHQRENGVWCIVLDWRAFEDDPDPKYSRSRDPLDRLIDRTFADVAAAAIDALPGRLEDALAIDAATGPLPPAAVPEEPELVVDDDITAVLAWPAFPAKELQAALDQWASSREPADDTWIQIADGDDAASWEIACGVRSTGAYVVLIFTPFSEHGADDEDDDAHESAKMDMVAVDGAGRTPRDRATLGLLPELFAVIASVRVRIAASSG